MMQFATSCQVSEMQDAILLLANRTPRLQRLGRNSVDVGAFEQAKHVAQWAPIITGMKLVKGSVLNSVPDTKVA